jgi:hypothetical protein
LYDWLNGEEIILLFRSDADEVFRPSASSEFVFSWKSAHDKLELPSCKILWLLRQEVTNQLFLKIGVDVLLVLLVFLPFSGLPLLVWRVRDRL